MSVVRGPRPESNWYALDKRISEDTRLTWAARGLLVLPATVLGGFVLISGWFTFWPGLLMRYTWDMVGMTVQGNSYQLALNAIPADLRARVRGFIEGFLNPLGGVLGGVAIIALHHLFDSSGTNRGWSDPVTLAGALLAVAWIIVVWRARKHYLDLVEKNLDSTDKRTAMDAIDCLEEPGNLRASELLIKVGHSPEIEKRMAAIRVWGNIGGAEAPFAAVCADPEVRVRLEALCAMSRAALRRPLAGPEIGPLFRECLAGDRSGGGRDRPFRRC